MLVNGAVTFITPIIPRRTIPGGIDARAVVEPPAPADPRAPAPAVVDTVANVLPLPGASGVLLAAINGVELRLAGLLALLDGETLEDGDADEG